MFHLHARPNATKFSIPAAPKCPTCNRSVYAAEQVLGPGSTPYHKSCLKCKHCSKTLDSSNVFEHGYDPYCKLCHAKNFGIKGVGYGNVLVGEYRAACEATSNPATSPRASQHRISPISSPTWSKHSPSPTTNVSNFSYDDSCKHDTSIDQDQISNDFKTVNENVLDKKDSSIPPIQDGNEYEYDESFEPPSSLDTLRIVVKPKLKTTEQDVMTSEESSSDTRLSETYRGKSIQSEPATGRTVGQIMSTPPRIPAKPTLFNSRVSSSKSPITSASIEPSPSRTDGPQKCPSCLQTVYHAEQVLAIGKKWHKRCLRCWQCKRALDSNLNERSGKPYCVKCYDNQFGAGSHGFVLRAGFGGK